jgi:signal transduction histidine kinase
MNFRIHWPTSLAGRTLLLLLFTAALVYLGAILAYRTLGERAAENGRIFQAAGRLEIALTELASLPVQQRASTAAALSSAGFRLTWADRALVDDMTASDPKLQKLRGQLATLVPGLAGRDIHLRWDEQGFAGVGNILLGAAQLQDGSYAMFSTAMLPTIIPTLPGALLTSSLVFFSLIAVAIIILRTINAPLRRLAAAADLYGHAARVTVLERGSSEIVKVQRAFNAMERRIYRLIEDRTQALAAVSHDLRTPISRLRLRCGLLSDQDMKADWERDLIEMETMIESTLAFLRGDVDVETPRLIDLMSLLTTLIDAAGDAGKSASLSGPRHCTLMMRVVSVKRAFGNLIDNAVIYGSSVVVKVTEEESNVRITIDDDGPGIPHAEIEYAFEPFRRFEPSRNRSTGGVGLGLTIAHQTIEREGGNLRVMNRSEGGLRAEIILPLSRRKSANASKP